MCGDYHPSKPPVYTLTIPWLNQRFLMPVSVPENQLLVQLFIFS